MGYTKGDLLNYYEKIAPTLLPYLKDRPISLSRYPDGITGMHFYQKNLSTQHLPPFVATKSIHSHSAGRSDVYALCQNKETLLYLANLGSIEMHPWASRVQHLSKPDYLLLDIDPGKKSSFEDAILVAQTYHEILESVGMRSLCKTSGKRGLHVYVPLSPLYTFKEVRQFALDISKKVLAKHPDITTLEHLIKKRKGRLYLDYSRNAHGQNMASAYSVRPAPEATVSTPLEWKEVKKGLDPKKFTIKTIFKRLKEKGDLWKPMLTRHEDLKKAQACLKSLSPIES